LAPIVPELNQVTESKLVEFNYEQKVSQSLIMPSTIQDINITNKKDVDGTFSVLMILEPGNY